jgi:hypothetical protein
MTTNKTAPVGFLLGSGTDGGRKLENIKMAGKCPVCQGIVTHLRGDGVQANFGGKSYNAVTYSCPACLAVLGSQIDPIAIRTDIIDMLCAELKRRGLPIQ